MRRPRPSELNAIRFLARHQPYCPGSDACAEPFILDTLNALVRGKWASAEATDDGPSFRLTSYGQREAADA